MKGDLNHPTTFGAIRDRLQTMLDEHLDRADECSQDDPALEGHLTAAIQLMGLPREPVTSDLWCREVPLEGCSPCPSPIPVSSART